MNIYTIRRDEQGYAAAIERNGWTILQIYPGSIRNEENIEEIVWLLNKSVEKK
jgi:hypothetical protein